MTAVGGPGSMVGFDLARTFNPPTRVGSATGIVNVGGFFASLSTVTLIGVILDVVAPGGPETYTVDSFRVAMSVQYLVWGIGWPRSCAIVGWCAATCAKTTPRRMPRCGPGTPRCRPEPGYPLLTSTFMDAPLPEVLTTRTVVPVSGTSTPFQPGW